MKWLILFVIFPLICSANPLSFKVQFFDYQVKVVSPEKKSNQYAIVVENKSLSDLYAKFQVGNKDLLFVSVKSGQFKTLEFKNESAEIVRLVPLNPPLQEVPLEFGKKTYEIPEPKQN